MLREERGALDVAPTERPRPGRREHGRQPGIGFLGGEGEVEHPQLPVVGEVGEPAVQLAPLAGSRPPARRRDEQGMGRQHAFPVEEDEAGPLRLVDRTGADQAGERRRPRLLAEAEGEEQPPRSRREGRHARPEQVLDAVRDRDPVVLDLVGRALEERATDLEEEQRVAARRVDDPTEGPPREGQAQPIVEDAPRRAQAERAERQVPRLPGPERALERGGPPRAAREEEPDVHVPEASCREGQGLGRPGIERGCIVDREEHRPLRRERPQRVQGGQGDRVRGWRGTVLGFGPCEGEREGVSLR